MLNYMLWTILISGISNTKSEYCGDDYFPLQQSDKAEYVECQCDHLSIFAAQGESDNRTGYKIYFFIVCFVCMVCYINFYFYFWDGEVSLKKKNSGIFLVIFSLENIFNREIVKMLASRNSCFPNRKLKLTSLFFPAIRERFSPPWLSTTHALSRTCLLPSYWFICFSLVWWLRWTICFDTFDTYDNRSICLFYAAI